MSLRLDHLPSSHYERAAKWLGDASVNQWMYAEWREHALDARTIAIAALNTKNRMWLISWSDEPYGLGCIGGMSKADQTGTAWYLRAPGQTRIPGLMTEAVRCMTQLGFRELGLHSISASVLEPNVASRRVLEGAGYRYVGCIREGFAFRSGFVNRLIFDCLQSDLAT